MTDTNPSGTQRITQERARQLNEEGYSIADDLGYTANELALAAQGYLWANEQLQFSIPAKIKELERTIAALPRLAITSGARRELSSLIQEMKLGPLNFVGLPPSWPWAQTAFKPSGDPVRNLEKAGALIAAEIDRTQASIEGIAVSS